MKASDKQYGYTVSVRSGFYDTLREYGIKDKKIYRDIPDWMKKEFNLPENMTRFCVECYGDWIVIKVKVGRVYRVLLDYDWDAGEGYSVDEFLAVFIENQDKKDSEIQKMLKKRA